jgi:hypothetical protein
VINKKKKDKLEKVNHTFGWVDWIVDDHHQRLKLSNFGMDPQKDLNFCLVSIEEVEHVFGKKRQNGWKIKVNEILTIANFCALLKLYEDIYAHPPPLAPPHGDYLIVFLHGWLAHHKGHKVNWSLYAHDCIMQQMKKTTQPPSSKSIILLANSNYNQSNATFEDESFVFLGERTFVVIFLPNQVVVVKKLLQKARDHKDNFMPIMAMLAEKTTTLQKKVQKLAHNHVDRVISAQ